MTSVVIRSAGPDDIPTIAGIMHTSFSDTYGEAWQGDDLPAVLAMPSTYARLALTPSSQAKGFYLWRQAAEEGELLLIAVHPNARGAGIGRRMLADMLTEARSAGVQELFLEVREGNATAKSLYLGQGFEMVGRRTGYYCGRDGRRHDALTLRYNLGGCHQPPVR